MTGKEIIHYIISNNLYDKEFLTNGIIPGYIHWTKAAVEFQIGTATLKIWCTENLIEHIYIGDDLYVLEDAPDPRKRGNNEAIKNNSINNSNQHNDNDTVIWLRNNNFKS